MKNHKRLHLCRLKRWIDEDLYYEIMAELEAVARGVGARIHFHLLPARAGLGAQHVINGYYVFSTRDIHIYVYGRLSRTGVLFVLAHEVRHALHVAEGLFSDCYENKVMRLLEPRTLRVKGEQYSLLEYLPLIDGVRLPCLETGIAAERDADSWAFRFLAERGVRAPWQPKYDPVRTLSYKYHYLLSEHDPHGYLALPGATPELFVWWHKSDFEERLAAG